MTSRRRTLAQPPRPSLREALVFILSPRCETLLDAQIIAARAIDPAAYPRASLRTQAEIRAYQDMIAIQTQESQEPKPQP